jgi:hypothetical protein
MYRYQVKVIALGSDYDNARTSGDNFLGARHGLAEYYRQKPAAVAAGVCGSEGLDRSSDEYGRNRGLAATYRFSMRQGALSPPERVPASEAIPLFVSPRHDRPADAQIQS